MGMKVVIAHPHQQHSYKLAAAVKKAGHELIYVTTVYNRPHTLTRIVSHLLKGSERDKAMSRRCNQIGDEEVHQFCELGGLLVLLLFRIDKTRKVYDFAYSIVRRRFGIKAAKFAAKSGADIFIGYDVCCRESFLWLKKHYPSIVRVVDYSAVPVPSQVQFAFNDLANMESNERQEIGKDLLGSTFRDYPYAVDELLLLDYAIAASDFTVKCLQDCGIQISRIFKAPYGFSQIAKTATDSNEKITFAFCGRLTRAKGIHRLLNAFSMMDHEKCHLLLIGKYDDRDPVIKSAASFCTLTGPLPHQEAIERLGSADVFVFPSITDGMSLACMEAMSLGLPVIVTSSTGASQFIENGVNGYVVDPSDERSLFNSMERFSDNPALISEMGKQSLRIAKSFGWDRYYSCVGEMLESICNDISIGFERGGL